MADQITIVGRNLVRLVKSVRAKVNRNQSERYKGIDETVAKALTAVDSSVEAALARWEAECSAQLTTRIAGRLSGAEEIARRGINLEHDKKVKLSPPDALARIVDGFVAPLDRAAGIQERLSESEASGGGFVLDAARMVDGLRESWSKLETAACRELTGDPAADESESTRALLNNISSSCQDAFRSNNRDRIEAELKTLVELSLIHI